MRAYVAYVILAIGSACDTSPSRPSLTTQPVACHAPRPQAPICASGERRELPWVLPSPAPGVPLVATSSVIADLDRDGRPDVVIGELGVDIFLGAAGGRFTPGPRFATTTQVGALAVGDLDRDGNPDLVAAARDAFVVLRSNADGSFQRQDIATSGAPVGVAVADVDGDGNLDLIATASDGCHFDVMTRLGRGDGSFGAALATPQANGLCGRGTGKLELEDLDGDGKLDIVMSAIGVEFLRGRGDGTFEAATVLDYQAAGFELGRFDGDGLLDIALDTGMLRGNGDGTFTRTSSSLAPGGGVPVLAGDVDGDHVTDLAIALDTNVTVQIGDPESGSLAAFWKYAISVLHGRGDGTFQAGPSQQLAQPVFAAAFADLDGDQVRDVLVATQTAFGSLRISGGEFDVAQYATPLVPTGGVQSAALVADLDGDHRPDVAVTANATVSVFSTLPGGSLGARVDYPTRGTPTGLVATDLEGDDIVDLVFVDLEDDGPVLDELRGKGDGTFHPAAAVATPLGFSEAPLAIGDLDGDGVADLAVPGAFSTIAVAHGRGDGTFGRAVGYPAGGGASQIVIADVNSDGIPDLVTLARSLTVLLGTADHQFSDFIEYPANVQAPAGVAIADVDGDGYPDAVVADAGNRSVSILRGSCDGRFQLEATYSIASFPGPPKVGDVNGDGHPDIILGEPVGVMYGHGDGTFGDLVTFGFGAGRVDVGDLDGNGQADLVWPAVAQAVNVLRSHCR